MQAVLEALLVTLRVAALATLLATPPAILLAYVLARRQFFGKSLVEALSALPLVLPPTAVGYLLLRAFRVGGPLGDLGLDLLLSPTGAVLASAIMAFPLVLRTARVAFEGVDRRLERMGASLGHTRVGTFARISVPLAKRGLVAGVVLGFGRAVGEFGATIVVAGNIPGKTQTLALLLYNDIQLGDDRRAVLVVGITAILAFVLMIVVERLLRESGRSGGSA